MREQGHFITYSEKETQELGRALGGEARSFSSRQALLVALFGELGAGKTAFAKGFARGLGIKEEMKSPTFILMRAFRVPKGKKIFMHFDAYRIKDAKEFLQIGFKHLLKDPRNILLVEWAENMASLLPASRIDIRMKHLEGDQRELRIYG